MLGTFCFVSAFVAYTYAQSLFCWKSSTPLTLSYFDRENMDGVVLDTTTYNLVKPHLETKILLHGFCDNGKNEWLTQMKRKYLIKAEYNVIIIDWSIFASSLNYFYLLAKGSVARAAEDITNILVAMTIKGYLTVATTHLIGHSLGAMLGGEIAERVHTSTGKKIGRLSCLDAAGPGYDQHNIISSTVAEFVDAIHTSTTLGYVDPFATADFIVNGGALQAGCDILSILHCNHLRAILLWIESIPSDFLIATECDSYENYERRACAYNPAAIMGENALKASKPKGMFYIDTNPNYPFAMGLTALTSQKAVDLDVNISTSAWVGTYGPKCNPCDDTDCRFMEWHFFGSTVCVG